MRRQYHFRPSAEGLLAWDVDKLVAATKGLQPLQVSLARIRELDEPYWFGDGVPPTVREIVEHFRLMEAADLDYPIILCPDLRVMDGMHRVAKAALRGDVHISACILRSLPPPDHVGVAPENLPY